MRGMRTKAAAKRGKEPAPKMAKKAAKMENQAIRQLSKAQRMEKEDREV